MALQCNTYPLECNYKLSIIESSLEETSLRALFTWILLLRSSPINK